MFDLKKFVGKLSDEELGELESEFAKVTSQRDQARVESIDSRKKSKAELERLASLELDLMEQYAVDDKDALKEAIVSGKAKADSNKQLERRLLKAESDLKAEREARAEIEKKHAGTVIDAAVSKAIGKHEWVDAEVVESVFRAGVSIGEDGAVMFKQTDGTFVSVDEGLTVFAKTKPHLVKSSASGNGSGFNPKGGNQKTGKSFKEMSIVEKTELWKADPSAYERMSADSK